MQNSKVLRGMVYQRGRVTQVHDQSMEPISFRVMKVVPRTPARVMGEDGMDDSRGNE